MVTENKFKFYTSEQLAQEWSADAWKEPPSLMVTLPFPGGVLFGAKTNNDAQRVSFFLHPEDAQMIGERLLNAARESDHGTA
ncbi:MAG: hypothetical protein VR71_23555 [Roseovarius sp. BRH_c41]|uniref:hypothetical protein n=1 Tax=Roseovarius sp. BRH_c41 TaxID=1629709 RepID=UPI0005F120BA|nr:hypothetical protein [Roseovarius sp. BRH_c41]KJS40289.1 MAG: hypothetical protein VR71_23555 [Roseovarius sp. BRH_c41]